MLSMHAFLESNPGQKRDCTCDDVSEMRNTDDDASTSAATQRVRHGKVAHMSGERDNLLFRAKFKGYMQSVHADGSVNSLLHNKLLVNFHKQICVCMSGNNHHNC